MPPPENKRQEPLRQHRSLRTWPKLKFHETQLRPDARRSWVAMYTQRRLAKHVLYRLQLADPRFRRLALPQHASILADRLYSTLPLTYNCAEAQAIRDATFIRLSQASEGLLRLGMQTSQQRVPSPGRAARLPRLSSKVLILVQDSQEASSQVPTA